MHTASIIAKKRDGGELAASEIEFVVQGFARGEVPDYQMAALAMAIYIRGMTTAETAELTEQMLSSGARLEWSAGSALTVDKHSTGGIGDKTSLILAPLLACCGLQVPMISGRGLGATGGTLDKLEAIPGFRTDLSMAEICEITERVGCVITGASAELAPADRKLYALRDVTATVPSIPLITASIMSKKLAESLDALVLDVKFGSGAFMKSLADARLLARSLVDTGRRMGVATSALITDMNQPLGRMAGNSVEVHESLAVLEGRGPEDLWTVTRELGIELLVSTNIATDRDAAGKRLDEHISSGRARDKFAEMVAAQGGDLAKLPAMIPSHPIIATRAGHISTIDTEQLGLAIIDLGGGRKVMTDPLDHSVGIEMLVRIGDQVHAGQPLLNVFAPRTKQDHVQRIAHQAIEITDDQVAALPLVVERL